MTTKMNIAVIGAGYWGKNLVRNHHALGNLAAVCDSSPDTLAMIAKNYPGVSTHRDLDDVLSDSSIEAVAIATPAAAHGDAVRRALDAGKHVFVEKPLCLDVAEARSLAKLAGDKNLTLMVGHLLLYHPAFIALKQAIDCGELGELRYIYSNRLSLGKIRREENALWSFAPHDISMILTLAGAIPESIVANGGSYLLSDVADTTICHFAFPGQLQAHIFVSWLHPYKDQRLVVVGNRGMAVFDDINEGAEKLLVYRHDVDWNGELPVINKAKAEPIAYDDAEPLRMECLAFADAVRHGVNPPSDAMEGIRVLSVLDACQRALVSGDRVSMGDYFPDASRAADPA